MVGVCRGTREQRARSLAEGWLRPRPKAGERGFTLIELLVVIIILGILSAVVVFAVAGVGDKGRAAAEAIDARTLRTAEEAFFAKNGRYATEEELVAAQFIFEQSGTHKIYLNTGAGACPAENRCEYSLARDDEEPELVVYSGRSSALVGPLLDQFEADTGIDVTAEYTGGSSGLATRLLNEGSDTSADVFFSQDAGTLGQVSRSGLFREAPPGAVSRVTSPKFVARDRSWVGVSGRVRVIAHDPAVVAPENVPATVFALTGPAWTGKVGYDPTNTSFQNFVAAMILTHGEEATTGWLNDFKANSPVRISGNLNIAKAVAAGTIQLGLINHYYRFQLMPAERARVANSYPRDGDPGALVNVAGTGIIRHTANPGAAEVFVKYLLSTPAQTYFRDRTVEYPLVSEVPPSPELVPLDQIEAPDIDLNDIDNAAAVNLLNRTGHLP